MWKNLDIAEAVAVRQWLMAPERGLNIKKIDQANPKWVSVGITYTYYR